MKVLVACEYSGIVRDAFIKRGHDAISCDLLDTEVPGPHYKGDVRDIINNGFDLMIAHPPCTYLSNSGVRWLYNEDGTKNEERWHKMREGANFFKEMLNAPMPHILIENPIMHKYAKEIIGVEYSQAIQPYQFGHGETKKTCFWLKNLPMIHATHTVSGRIPRVHHLGPSEDRWKERSRTYPGIAEAIAQQLSQYLRVGHGWNLHPVKYDQSTLEQWCKV